ncbi:MAG: sulfur carrier protein ThiS [Xanthomonadales bacterium]|nr:sulfur carrier protein ThiS [Xanthomonadales bacterium]
MLNGSSHDLPEGTTVQSLLQQLDLGQRRVAVEVNEEIIPRSQHPSTTLNSQDRVEIVHAIGGG